MAKGRVYHWKHGWIPLDGYARSIVADRQGGKTDIRPPAAALKRAKARQAAWKAAHESAASSADIKAQQVGGFRLTTVDGYPHVYFKEVVELDPRPAQQYREVAKTVTDALKPYPRATKANPVEIGWSNELEPTVMADTNRYPPHKIRLQPEMWDEPGKTMAQVADMRTRHFGVTAEASDLETFRRNVITHELGHLLHMRDQDEAARSAGVALRPEIAEGLPFGEISKFASEKVTPRSLGYTDVAPLAGGNPMFTVDTPFDRWQVDSLDHQSAYAMSDQYEFFAEAFLDGTINGDHASESGKRAVALASKIFGPDSPTLRDRLYGKGM